MNGKAVELDRPQNQIYKQIKGMKYKATHLGRPQPQSTTPDRLPVPYQQSKQHPLQQSSSAILFKQTKLPSCIFVHRESIPKVFIFREGVPQMSRYRALSQCIRKRVQAVLDFLDRYCKKLVSSRMVVTRRDRVSVRAATTLTPEQR
jgi:hypothetical protein